MLYNSETDRCEEEDRYQSKTKVDMCQLKISGLNKADAGMYECVAIFMDDDSPTKDSGTAYVDVGTIAKVEIVCCGGCVVEGNKVNVLAGQESTIMCR